jgi:hypothetical protein
MVGYPTCLSDFDISIRWPTVSKKSKYSRSQSRLCTRNWLDCSCVSRWPNHVHSFCFRIWIHQWETSAVLKGLFPFTPAPSSLSGHPSPPFFSVSYFSTLKVLSKLSRASRIAAPQFNPVFCYLLQTFNTYEFSFTRLFHFSVWFCLIVIVTRSLDPCNFCLVSSLHLQNFL